MPKTSNLEHVGESTSDRKTIGEVPFYWSAGYKSKAVAY